MSVESGMIDIDLKSTLGPRRAEPLCPIFHECDGCSYQDHSFFIYLVIWCRW